MPIFTISADQDPRHEQRQPLAASEFRVDLGDFPELTHTAAVRSLPIVWPIAQVNLDISHTTDSTRSEDDMGM